MPTLMSLIDPAVATGITAQAGERQNDRHQRRQNEHALVGARRDDRLLEDELQEVGERLQHAPRADDVRSAAQMHRAPDLALEVDERRRGEQQADKQQQALEHVAQSRAEVARMHPPPKSGEDAAADQKPRASATTTTAATSAPTPAAASPDDDPGRGDSAAHRAYSAACRSRDCARAEHSAMVREARAIGLVR